MRHDLVRLVLTGHMASLDEPAAREGRLLPKLDVDTCALIWLDELRLALDIEFSLVLVRPDDDEIVGDIAATWRLVYECEGAPADERKFATTRGVDDSWAAWRTWLNATMAWMELPPLQLPPVPPKGLKRLAREAWDLDVDV